MTQDTAIVLNKASNILDKWRVTNGWVSNTWENIVATETDTDVEAKNEYDHQPPYVNTMITQSGTTLVLVIQRNKTEIRQPLLNVAINALGLRSDLDILYPAVGIGTIAASILFITLQKLHYVPIKRGETESNFQNTLNVASNVMRTILSNINILNDTDCHPRLQSHSVIKFVEKKL